MNRIIVQLSCTHCFVAVWLSGLGGISTSHGAELSSDGTNVQSTTLELLVSHLVGHNAVIATPNAQKP